MKQQWEARSRSVSDGALIVADQDHNEICCVVEKKFREYGEEDKQRIKNAVLMAAAPDLLCALEELLEHIEWRRRTSGETTGPNDCTHRARAAIAKATQC